jgi:Rrf2 family transcriptional regulator, cysteine metabolism repressor
MNISSRTRYGIRAVAELACNYKKKPLPLKIIADRQGISVKYLERVIAALKTAGIVKSARGSQGGYFLAKPPDQIKLIECFRCLEGQVALVDCVKNKGACRRFADCLVKGLWIQVNDAVENVLGSLTLQDLVDSAKNNAIPDYQI